MKGEHKIVMLDITSYVGLSIGAEHSYGTMHHRYGDKRKKVEVERPMTRAEAARENKKDREKGFPDNFNRAGTMTSRLHDEEDVVNTALEIWHKHFPYAHILLQQHSYSSEPGKILAGPDEKRNLQINLLWADYEQATDEGWDEEDILRTSAEWEKELEAYLSDLPELEYAPESEEDEYNRTVAEAIATAKRECQEEEARKQALIHRREQENRERNEWYDAQPRDEIAISATARSVFVDKGDGSHLGHLTFFAVSVGVTDDDGNEIGSIECGLGGSVWFSHKALGEELYKIDVEELWRAIDQGVKTHLASRE